MSNILSNLPAPVGSYVRLNGADIVVDTDLDSDGQSDGNTHRIYRLNGDLLHDNWLTSLPDEEVNDIIDELLRGKFEKLS